MPRARSPSTPYEKAVAAINKHGVLLVFPLKNERDPLSLWHALYPRSTMRWDWAETADDRVVDLWHLRTELSESRDVVYGKWFRGRATFFSRDVFTALLKVLGTTDMTPGSLSGEAAALYSQLLDDSPQTSRTLRRACELEGREYESAFNRGMKPLWSRLLAVGFGEIDEGSFPSLAIGATKLLFEELWDGAIALDEEEAERVVDSYLPKGSAYRKALDRLRLSRPE